MHPTTRAAPFHTASRRHEVCDFRAVISNMDGVVTDTAQVHAAAWKKQALHRTVDHYLRRTSHGSTLSRLVHGWVAARTGRAAAWETCTVALLNSG